MPVSRIDLADAGSPEKIVMLILQKEPDLPIPVPIEQLCRQLDIEDFQPLETEGFEGGLLTDSDRSSGIILLKKGVFPQRQRFTIAHELGHFLIPTHVPDSPGRFLCSRSDMQKLSSTEGDKRSKMEVEANRFASLILMPPPALRCALQPFTEPSLHHIPKLALEFQVSKEAMAKAYATYHEAPIAIVVVQNGKILRSYRNATTFPFIQPSAGSPVPSGSLYHRGKCAQGVASDFAECLPDIWIETQWGKRSPALYEQVYAQQSGFALIMLHIDKPDEDDESEEHDLERSWQVGFHKRR